MINKVGISNKLNINPQYNKRSSFEFITSIDNTIQSIGKITSVLCSADKIHLEKSPTGILVIIDFKVKIIYSPKELDTLYVFEKFTSTISEIETTEKIEGESIMTLLKGKGIWGKVDIYDISAKIIGPKEILLKVYFYSYLQYSRRMTVGFIVSQQNLNANLYLADSNFTNMEQITYEMNSCYTLLKWSNISSTIYYVNEVYEKVILCEYNKKLNKHTIIFDGFKNIINFKEFNNEILILGSYLDTYGLYLFNRDDNNLREVYLNDNILDFVKISSNTIFILLSNEGNYVLQTIDFSLFGNDNSLSIKGTSFIFAENSDFAAFIENSKIHIVALPSLKIIPILTLNSFEKVSYIGETCKGDLLILGNINDTCTVLFTYSINKNKVTLLSKKNLQIQSISINNSKTIVYISLKLLGELNIISIDLKNTYNSTTLFNVKGESITLAAF